MLVHDDRDDGRKHRADDADGERELGEGAPLVQQDDVARP
jgi:hypothetical protein